MKTPRVVVDADKIVVVASSDDNYAIPLHVLFSAAQHQSTGSLRTVRY